MSCTGTEQTLAECSVNQRSSACTNPTAAASVQCILQGSLKIEIMYFLAIPYFAPDSLPYIKVVPVTGFCFMALLHEVLL